jgi:hypothetical protein
MGNIAKLHLKKIFKLIKKLKINFLRCTSHLSVQLSPEANDYHIV